MNLSKKDILTIEDEIVDLFKGDIRNAVRQNISALKHSNDASTTRYVNRWLKRALFHNTDKKYSDIKQLLEMKQYYNKNYGENKDENKIQDTNII
tara:strand:+ start:429 stop:713 length:285 start_codon:yes stop_codon:yes gene_type:complete